MIAIRHSACSGVLGGTRVAASGDMARATSTGEDWPALSDEDRRGIARIRRQLDEEFGIGPEAPRWLERSRRPLLLVVLAVAVACAGGGAARPLLSASPTTDPPPRPVIAAAPSTVAEPEVTPVLAVRTTLDAWIDATQRGDLATQMMFYPDVVPVFYTWRNAPSEAVLGEKQRVLGAAWTRQIRTGAPTIDVAPDGETAVTRFRKAYVIEGPYARRRGAVIQELRWTRTPDGWKITSERDAVLLAPGPRRSGADPLRLTGRRALATTDTSLVGRFQAP